MVNIKLVTTPTVHLLTLNTTPPINCHNINLATPSPMKNPPLSIITHLPVCI